MPRLVCGLDVATYRWDAEVDPKLVVHLLVECQHVELDADEQAPVQAAAYPDADLPELGPLLVALDRHEAAEGDEARCGRAQTQTRGHDFVTS